MFGTLFLDDWHNVVFAYPTSFLFGLGFTSSAIVADYFGMSQYFVMSQLMNLEHITASIN